MSGVWGVSVRGEAATLNKISGIAVFRYDINLRANRENCTGDAPKRMRLKSASGGRSPRRAKKKRRWE